MNIMLDGLPTEYDGYLIRTDFRIGIQISEALNDVNLADPEKLAVAAELLFGRGAPPDGGVVYEAIQWFMSGGEPAEHKPAASSAPVFDFEQDNRRVYSAFRARFGIDLVRERLHWFAFLAMLADIGECSLSDIMGIRSQDLSKLSGEQQKKCAVLQQQYRIKPQMSDAEKAILAEFEASLDI